MEGILTYSPWFLGEAKEPRSVAEGKRHGKGLIARLKGCEDRDQAAALAGKQILIGRDQLPPPGADEFYWSDLEGLKVETLNAEPLGAVERLFATPGNDVLIVRGERERLIPFLWNDVVKDVDFDHAIIRVDWDPDF